MIFQLGLTGYPLGQSLSPKLHDAALRACGLQGDYSLFPIHPDDKQGMEDLLVRVRSGDIYGLNVTIPYKQKVIPLLDGLTPIAQAVGAVNTIYMKENKLIGHNTDVQGFLTDLTCFLNHSSLVTHHSSLVLGAGGSARAVIYALLNNGWKITIAARRIEQARQLADTFANYKLSITNFNLSNIEKDSTDLRSLIANPLLIVNATPLGMTPHTDQSPWPANMPFPQHATIYDLVYNPSETKLVQSARSYGLPATTGLGMLVEQAALAFEIWTGHSPSREILHSWIQCGGDK